jgi:hypothetical protein
MARNVSLRVGLCRCIRWRRPFCHAVLFMSGSSLGAAIAGDDLRDRIRVRAVLSASMSTEARLLQLHMVVLVPARALSRTGSFHPGRTKWHVYPFGMRSR